MSVLKKAAKATVIRQFLKYKKSAKIFALFLLCLMVFSSVVLYLVESTSDNHSLEDFFWTSIFTIIGAADFAEKHPTSPVGKLIIFFLSLCGVGIVGWIIAELAGNFVLSKLKEALGMGQSKFRNHYIICGWNYHAKMIVEEMSKSERPFVLLADLEENPLSDYEGSSLFIKGDPGNEENLTKAGIEYAEAAIILADRLGDKSIDDVDARTILTALSVEKVSSKLTAQGGKDITTVVELLNPQNKHHAEHAGVDDIILYNDFAAKLFVTCALNKGISKVFSDLLSFDEGYELYTRNLPSELEGKSFDDAIAFYRQRNSLPIAIFNGGSPVINPAPNEQLTGGCSIVLIAKNSI